MSFITYKQVKEIRPDLLQHHNPVEAVFVRHRVDSFDLNLLIFDRFPGRAQLPVDVVSQSAS